MIARSNFSLADKSVRILSIVTSQKKVKVGKLKKTVQVICKLNVDTFEEATKDYL